MKETIVDRCDECQFYETQSDVIEARCTQTWNTLPVATASPYKLSAAEAKPPHHCPLRKGTIDITVRLGDKA